MTENDIHIAHIKVGELPEFAERVILKAKPGQFIPITYQRAIAHANNPYADPEDVGLLAAIDRDDEVVGYFGIMPMLLRVGDQVHKTHWFTTWSVSPKVRGRGVGSDLMREAITLEKDFLIVGSVHARRVCQKYGFWEREPLRYYWLAPSGMGSLNPMTWIMRLFRKITHRLKIDKEIAITNPGTRMVERLFSPLTRQIFYPLLTRKLASILASVRYQEVPRISAAPPVPVNHPEVELHRGIEAVNWMLAYPWIVETGRSRTEKMDYYFSDARPLYRFIALEIYDPGDNAYLGYVVYSISRKASGMVLKTLDFQFSDPAQYPVILALAVHFGRQYQAGTLELPAEAAEWLKGSFFGRLFLQEKARIYQCYPKSESSPLAKAWREITLHLYDGDMAFS